MKFDGTILIAEDNDGMRRLLLEFLKPTGARLLEAPDGLAAWELAQQTPPDLVISDLTMPRMDGMEFCRRMKEHPTLSTIHFIFLTSRKEFALKVSALESGADDYIDKSARQEELLARVHVGFRIVNYQRQLKQHQAEIARLSRLKDEFLNTITLHFRGTLEVLAGITGLLGEGHLGPLAPVQKEMLQAAQDKIGGLLDLANGFSDLKEVERSRMELSLAPVPLADLARDVATLYERIAALQRVKLIFSVEAGATISGDRQKLEMMLVQQLNYVVRYAASMQPVYLTVKGRAVVLSYHLFLAQELLDQTRFRVSPQEVEKQSASQLLGRAMAQKIMVLHGGEARWQKDSSGREHLILQFS